MPRPSRGREFIHMITQTQTVNFCASHVDAVVETPSAVVRDTRPAPEQVMKVVLAVVAPFRSFLLRDRQPDLRSFS